MYRAALKLLFGVFLYLFSVAQAFSAAPLKVCFIYLTEVGDHGWTYAHEMGRVAAQNYFGDRIKTTFVKNVPEGPSSKPVIEKLAAGDCNLIVATSFGYMDSIIEVATDYPDVNFIHIAGYKRSTNVATADIRYYEGSYVQGVVAGKISKTNILGYVASFPIPQVYQQINAFTIGAREANPNAQVKVIWAETWYNPEKEVDAAKILISEGADVVASNTDSPAVLATAQQAGIFSFGNHSDMNRFGPKAHLLSLVSNWEAYYIDAIGQMIFGEWDTGDSPYFWNGNTWKGVADNFLTFSDFSNLPDDAKKSAFVAIQRLKDGQNIFSGPIADNEGNLKLRKNDFLDDAQLWSSLDYFVEGVDVFPFKKSPANEATGLAANSNASSLQLKKAQEEADKLRKRLAVLEAQKEQQQATISADSQVPLITITQSGTDQRKGIIRGFVRDNVQVAEVLVDGVAVSLDSDGSFEWSGFVPATGKDIIIEAIDTAALSSSKVIRLERGQIKQASGPRFDDLDPTAGRRVKRNNNALALIVGISDYERTDAPAIYADKDAQYFHDYASLKLGIPDSNITTLVNDKAEQGDVFLAVADWMRRSSKPGKSDFYIFFAGHGLASQDGEQMYLLPYDGRPRLLDKTAILRDELFADIAQANPRSVTVFLDTCYSGATRGPDMLIASRPIVIRAKESAIPQGFTVMTAAAGDQTAKPLEEAKHGMFSYFLMKGMEGDADANQDNQITAGELHAYVQQNVIQQSSGSQTPELQGDATRVLVRFQ